MGILLSLLALGALKRCSLPEGKPGQPDHSWHVMLRMMDLNLDYSLESPWSLLQKYGQLGLTLDQ